MKMIRWLAPAALLFALDVQAERREFEYPVDVTVDASGQPIAADVLAEIDPAFEASVVGLMKSWRFKPATQAGQAVPSRTSMWVKVTADIEAGAQARLTARYISHGNMMLQGKPPHYPESAIRQRSEAEVVLEIAFDAEGNPTSIEPFQIKVTGGDRRMAKLFHAEAHNTIASWRVRPEVVDGKAVASRLLIPFGFSLSNGSGRPLKATLDRAAESDDAALKLAAGKIISGNQRSVPIDNSTGLELISDTGES